MQQKNLFPETPQEKNDHIKMIGANLSLVFNKKNKNLVTLKNRDVIVKKADLSDKPAKKRFVIDAVELGATKTRLAEALNISRQTIDNYIGSKERFGTEGLLGGYHPDMGKNLSEHRKDSQHKRIQGNKAVILAEERKANFKHQLYSGVVGAWLWFTDGHLLPYAGKQKVHSGYNTQRKLMMPGQTNMVTCDMSGRIVDFQIQEGKGDLKAHIVALKEKWVEELPESPIMVFDREGHGAPFFYQLIEAEIPFVTREKHMDAKKLNALDDALFKDSFEMNHKKYRVFEGEKKFKLEQDKQTHPFTQRTGQDI